MRQLIWAAALLAVFGAGHKAARAQELKLEEYLLQVRGSHPGLKGAREAMQGAEMRAGEGNLLFMPQFELSAERVDDKKEYANTQFNGTQSTVDLYQAAIAQQTPIGLSAKFGYTFMRQTVQDSMQPTLNYTASPMIEVNLPLWRNALGSEIRAQRDKALHGNKAQFYEQRLKVDSIALEAESAYSGLYFARQTTIARRESLEVAKKLLDWMSKRAVNELADDNDLNQAKAAFGARELELLKAENSERGAARAFNSLRGISADRVEEALSFRPPALDISKQANNLTDDRVRAVEKQKLMAKADLRLALEQHRPKLNIYGKYSYNGMDRENDRATSEAWKSDHPYQAVGVSFEAPIVFWKTKEVTDGYRRSLAAADYEVQRLHQEKERDLNNLYSNIEVSQKLVSLSQRLVETQKKKLEKERQRHRRGRTTLFQVLQYEQEYVGTQLEQIGYQAELVNLTHKLRLYRGE